jgi:hypothetical protein
MKKFHVSNKSNDRRDVRDTPHMDNEVSRQSDKNCFGRKFLRVTITVTVKQWASTKKRKKKSEGTLKLTFLVLPITPFQSSDKVWRQKICDRRKKIVSAPSQTIM